MLPGPVFHVELLTLARRGRYYALRFLYGAVLLLIVWSNDPGFTGGYGVSSTGEMSIQAMARLGEQLFSVFAITQSVVVLLIVPPLVAGVIADERSRKTLDYLLSSQLSSVEIVLGKLAARLLHIGVFLALGLPVLVMLSLFGGVDPNVVLLLFAATASTTFFLAAAAVLVSTLARRPRDAVLTVYLLELAWLFLPTLAEAVFPTLGGPWQWGYEAVRPLVGWVGATSPFHLLIYGLGRFMGPTVLDPFLTMIGLQVVLGGVFVAVAVLWLRPGFRREGSGGRLAGLKRLRLPRRLLPRPACGNDPMLWKELHVVRAGALTRVVGFLVLLAVCALTGAFMTDLAEKAWQELAVQGYGSGGTNLARENLNGFLRFIMTLTASFTLVWVASAAAGSISGERESDTWISLLSTPLTPAEVVRAKLAGALWSARLLILIWLGLLALGLLLGAVHPFGAVAAGAITAVDVVSGALMGLHFSLRARNSGRALTATIATLILLNGAYLIVLLPIFAATRAFNQTSLWAFLITPVAEAAALMSYRDFDWLFTPPAPPFGSNDLWLTTILSFASYTIAGLVLWENLVRSFDGVLDRPPSSSHSWGPVARPALPEPETVSRAPDGPG